MTFALILFLTAFAISSVAAYYSVAGLVTIFSSASIASVIMGGSLEAAKLVAASWLYRNWQEAPKFLKYYFTTAVIILSIITSMGIFGYLSKAHLDQSVVIGESTSKLSIYDEKIKTEKENIEINRKALKQMDDSVDQVLGRSTDEKGADKAVAIRRSQQKERVRLQNEILQSQKSIAELNDARAPIAAETRKIEAEVGPIKYVAELIYGESNEEVISKAVRLMIILIIFVFDPLAILLLIAANMEIKKATNVVAEKKEESDVINDILPVATIAPIKPKKPKKPIAPKKSPIKPKKKPDPIKKTRPVKPRKKSIGSGEDAAIDDVITIKKNTVYRFDS
jgi:hypothetical protein